jgi:hypothetical protein
MKNASFLEGDQRSAALADVDDAVLVLAEPLAD